MKSNTFQNILLKIGGGGQMYVLLAALLLMAGAVEMRGKAALQQV